MYQIILNIIATLMSLGVSVLSIYDFLSTMKSKDLYRRYKNHINIARWIFVLCLSISVIDILLLKWWSLVWILCTILWYMAITQRKETEKI